MLYWMCLQGVITAVVIGELATIGTLAFLYGLPWAVGLEYAGAEA